jgi:hypothetical protein
MGMIRPQAGGENGQGALVVRPCPRQIPHVLQQCAQVVEAGGRVGVVGVECFFPDGKGALEVRPCPGSSVGCLLPQSGC